MEYRRPGRETLLMGQPSVDSFIELDAIQGVLLDFDGPICALFSGVSAAVVAAELTRKAYEIEPIKSSAAGVFDPIQVLRDAAAEFKNKESIIALDQFLSGLECTAADLGNETSGSIGLIEELQTAAVPLAVVSNNSALAVRKFLMGRIGTAPVIVGRETGCPEKMKPSPFALLKAASELGVPIGSCVMIGDSVSDIDAARRAGCFSIGFVNSSSKHKVLEDAGADMLVPNIAELRIVLARFFDL